METLIDINNYPVKSVLKILLQDHTTGMNIIWATDSYSKFGKQYEKRKQITEESLLGLNSIVLQPRAYKSVESQKSRTKASGEYTKKLLLSIWLIS